MKSIIKVYELWDVTESDALKISRRMELGNLLQNRKVHCCRLILISNNNKEERKGFHFD